MAKGPMTNTINKSKGNMKTPEHNYPTIENPEYPSTYKTQENDIKFNLIKVIEAFKAEINKSHKEIQKNTKK